MNWIPRRKLQLATLSVYSAHVWKPFSRAPNDGLFSCNPYRRATAVNRFSFRSSAAQNDRWLFPGSASRSRETLHLGGGGGYLFQVVVDEKALQGCAFPARTNSRAGHSTQRKRLTLVACLLRNKTRQFPVRPFVHPSFSSSAFFFVQPR